MKCNCINCLTLAFIFFLFVSCINQQKDAPQVEKVQKNLFTVLDSIIDSYPKTFNNDVTELNTKEAILKELKQIIPRRPDLLATIPLKCEEIYLKEATFNRMSNISSSNNKWAIEISVVVRDFPPDVIEDLIKGDEYYIEDYKFKEWNRYSLLFSKDYRLPDDKQKITCWFEASDVIVKKRGSDRIFHSGQAK